MRTSIDIRQRVQVSRTPAAPRVALGAAAARRCAPAITRPSYNGAGAAVRRLVQTPKTAAVESPAIVAEPLPTPKQPEQFNWYKNWYPAALLESLQPDKPNALQLLGMDLVAWRTPEGEWSVLEDACPHRLAPLSEGRLHDDGTLMCSYHGWTFDGKGACKSIPQMADPKALATATGSARACVKRYPSQELFGILWVWAEAGPTAWIESAATTPTSLAPDLLSGDWVPKGTWFQRDVPVSFDTLVENVVDPSHVQFSHHGVIGDRGAPAQAAASIVGDITCKGGFTVGYSGIGQRVENVVFSPPSSSRWHFPGDVHLQLFATPTRVGWTRVFVNMIGDKNSPNKRPPNNQLPLFVRIMITVIDSVPWLQHPLQQNKILDGDDYFLHKAERRLYKQGSHESWPKQYYMPGSIDAGVIGWRRWLDDFGSALPVLPRSAADLGPVLPKREMFDRYEQHTKDCPHCLAALRNINIAIGVLAAVAAVSLGAVVAAAVTGAAPLLSPFCAKAGAAGAVAAAVVAGLLKFRQLFIYYEYDHSEH